jgi:predicted metal-dependent hydrolase
MADAGVTINQGTLEKGINLFNERRYFEAHEEWEHEWRVLDNGEEKTFLQGLIMVAGSFYHYLRHECAGAVELLKKSMPPLRSGLARHPDVSIAEFISRLERLQGEFEKCTFGILPHDLPIIRRNLVNW